MLRLQAINELAEPDMVKVYSGRPVLLLDVIPVVIINRHKLNGCWLAFGFTGPDNINSRISGNITHPRKQASFTGIEPVEVLPDFDKYILKNIPRLLRIMHKLEYMNEQRYRILPV